MCFYNWNIWTYFVRSYFLFAARYPPHPIYIYPNRALWVSSQVFYEVPKVRLAYVDESSSNREADRNSGWSNLPKELRSLWDRFCYFEIEYKSQC